MLAAGKRPALALPVLISAVYDQCQF